MIKCRKILDSQTEGCWLVLAKRSLNIKPQASPLRGGGLYYIMLGLLMGRSSDEIT